MTALWIPVWKISSVKIIKYSEVLGDRAIFFSRWLLKEILMKKCTVVEYLLVFFIKNL